MDRARLSGFVLAFAGALAIGACSSSSDGGARRTPHTSARAAVATGPRRTLRTPAQASSFLVAVARHGGAERWALAARASLAAQRVWYERGAIEDLGDRIRREGGEWGCTLVAASYRVGHDGTFSVGDRTSQASDALASGAKQNQVEAFYSDILKLKMSDLRAFAVAVCPYPYFG